MGGRINKFKESFTNGLVGQEIANKTDEVTQQKIRNRIILWASILGGVIQAANFAYTIWWK